MAKFSGFLLIPVYARVFSAPEFGVLELVVTLVKFLLFVCNLEIYTSIGRYFHDKNTVESKATLISTGLIITLGSTVLVILCAYAGRDWFAGGYLKDTALNINFDFIFLWLLIEALATYVSVIPRYENKPKLFVMISTIALFARVSSTLIFVLIFELGLNGVLLGHVVGASVTLTLNCLVSKKYFRLIFSLADARNITTFALPIVPGVLLIGFWSPLSRELVSNFYSLYTLGLLAFAFRIASVLEILNGAVRAAWYPLVFEESKNTNFKKNIEDISILMGTLTFTLVIVLTLLSPEISFHIGSEKYVESAILIGFLSLAFVYEMLKKMRGFSPLLRNKTIYLTYVELIGVIIGSLSLYFFKHLGLLGVGLAFLIPAFIKCSILTCYTMLREKITLFHKHEGFFLALFSLSVFMVSVEAKLLARVLIIAVTFLGMLLVLEKKLKFYTKAQIYLNGMLRK